MVGLSEDNPMAHHHFARTIGGVVAVAAMTAGCDKSPSGPTSSPAPALPAVSVSAVAPDVGATDGVTIIQVSGVGFKTGATLALGGVAADVTGLTSTLITARTPIHDPGAVDVVVSNPGGESASLKGGYSFAVIALSASPSLVTAGENLTLDWVGPTGRPCNGGGDWIAIYPMGAPDITGAANGHSNLWYTHLCGASAGVSIATAPNQPGEYEFRFMIGDTSVARSNPVRVVADAFPSTASERGREK
jgi:IPT/TIG domain-containing protein